MRRITVDGRRFAVGESDPSEDTHTPVMFVHGFPLDRRMWDGVADAMAGRRLLTPDMRGFGESDPLGSEPAFTIDDLADDVVGLAEAAGVSAPFDLVGLSMGGYVALSVAARHPDRVRRLVLSNTKASPDTPEAAAARRRVAEQTLRDGTDPLAATMTPKLLSETTREDSPEVVETVAAMIRRCRPETVAAAQHAMAARPDRTADLPSIASRTLCIAGDDDRVTPPSFLEAIACRLPRARCVTIPRAGHLAPLERPRRFAAVLCAFLDAEED